MLNKQKNQERLATYPFIKDKTSLDFNYVKPCLKLKPKLQKATLWLGALMILLCLIYETNLCEFNLLWFSLDLFETTSISSICENLIKIRLVWAILEKILSWFGLIKFETMSIWRFCEIFIKIRLFLDGLEKI